MTFENARIPIARAVLSVEAPDERAQEMDAVVTAGIAHGDDAEPRVFLERLAAQVLESPSALFTLAHLIQGEAMRRSLAQADHDAIDRYWPFVSPR
jgi:hypothetical protein